MDTKLIKKGDRAMNGNTKFILSLIGLFILIATGLEQGRELVMEVVEGR